MTPRSLIEQDQQLKSLARSPRESKPRYNWFTQDPDYTIGPILVWQSEGKLREMGQSDIADRIGHALTDLLMARRVEQIYTEQNRRQVHAFSRTAVEELLSRTRASEFSGHLTEEEVDKILEQVLVRHQAHDLARSLVARRISGVRAEADIKTRVIRRNGEAVSWNTNKIEIAVRKSFLSQDLDSAPAVAIAEAVERQMRESAAPFIHIEDLQDRVQEELMRQGHFKVASAYILYRHQRSDLRNKERLEEAERAEADVLQESMILVREADGTTSLWDGLDLRKRVEYARLDLELNLSGEEIEQELRRSIVNEISREALRTTVIMNAKSLLERDADFARFAARILLTYFYEEVLGWDILRDGIQSLPQFHRRAFKRNLARGVEIDRLSPKLLEYNLDKLAEALDPAADLGFDSLGVQTLYDRYLIVDKTGENHVRIETPQLFFMRVSMGLFLGEPREGVEDRIIALYRLYKSRRFCSSTPTLFNSGTRHSQLSSCYLYKVDDSIESIMIRGIAENAFLAKWAGGLGGSWTAVRGTGSYIKGTNGESQGVIPFLKLHNDQLVAVNQGGKRKGSGCAYIESWHNDVFDFLELRRNTGDERRRTHDMNTANWIPDLFMKRMEARQHWTLFRTNEAPDLHDLYGQAFEKRYEEYERLAEQGKLFGRKVQALDLWKEMLRMIFETGHPWITFKDPCNVRSPQDHVGVIHSSNLCTEITLNTSAEETAVCNLGSVVLENHLDADGNIDHEKLRETIRTAIRALDNVIDINFYPTDAAKTSNLRHRPIGLGVMGLQFCLYQKNIPFASEEAVAFNDEIMEAVTYYAYEASSDLAAERGAYSTYKGSKWDRGLLPPDTLELLERERGLPIQVPRGGKMDWNALREKIKRQGMRNSNVIAIAPTATISNIMGSCPCIEPSFKNLYSKSNLSGDFIILNPYLVKDLKKLDLWSREMCTKLKYYDGELEDIQEIPKEIKLKYLTAFSIPFEFLVDAAARRQKWIDQSQSLNLFLPKPDPAALSRMYRRAWHSGLKTTYYLRTQGASNIEKATLDLKKEMRGVLAEGISTAPAPIFTKVVTAEEREICSLNARMNGVECESCT